MEAKELGALDAFHTVHAFLTVDFFQSAYVSSRPLAANHLYIRGNAVRGGRLLFAFHRGRAALVSTVKFKMSYYRFSPKIRAQFDSPHTHKAHADCAD